MDSLSRRLDMHAAIWAALRSLDIGNVVTSIDAGADPSVTPITVVAEPVARQVSYLTRGVHEVTFSIVTYAGSELAARNAHIPIADATLSLSKLEHDNVQAQLSNVLCTVEPSAVPTTAAHEWRGVVSSYSAYIRTWR